MRNAVPSGRTPWRTIGIDVALLTGMRATTSFDLWSTEQVLLVYERYFGKLDAKTRRRIAEHARLNGWDRSWGASADLLAA
jgi:hypothetical protein